MGQVGRWRRRKHEPAAYADVTAELTLMTFRRLGPTVLLSTVGTIFALGLIAYRAGDPALWKLAFGMTVIGALRFGVIVAFGSKPRSPMTTVEATRWLQWYGYATFLHVLTISTSTLYTFSHHSQLASCLCTIAVFAQCAGLGTRPGMVPWFKQGCSLTMLIALAISISASGAMLAGTADVIIAFFAYAHCEAIQNQFNIVVELIRSQRKLKELAEQDTLTGLANRRYFQQALEAACEQPTQPFAILYIDLDRFKSVNDTFGHLTGDVLLSRVAERLKRSVRGTDLVARIGGDEFSILQGAVVSLDDAKALAARIVRDLSRVFQIEGHEIHIGASVGIQLSSESVRDPHILLANADNALYRVKQSGGGSFSLSEGKS